MITLKLNGYTTEELKLLHELIRSNIITVQNNYCDTVSRCKVCPANNVCKDLYRVNNFLDELDN